MLAHQAGEPAHVLAALGELADATGVNGMVGGQYLDVAGLAESGDVDVRQVHELKTGRLIVRVGDGRLAALRSDGRSYT